jgi:hypothetical protein
MLAQGIVGGMTTERLVTIARFLDLIEARIVAGRLEAAEIPVHLLGIHHANANSLLTVALGGVQLQVPASRVADAKEILAEDVALDDDTDVCPTCGSVYPDCGHERDDKT